VTAAFAVVLLGAGASAGEIEQVVTARRRPCHTLGRTDALPSPQGVRGLALVGSLDEVEPPASLTGSVAGFHAAGVPILGVGAGAAVVVDALGGRTVDAPLGPRLVRVSRTEAAEKDKLCAGLTDGLGWFAAGPTLAGAEGGVAVAVDDAGAPAVLRFGDSAYAVTFHPELPFERLAELVSDRDPTASPAAIELRARVLSAHGAAFVGRWVDGVVGRTDDEMPWGRKGPKPVAAPGLWLNPA
jgi:GMP synthase-like glutamine amidotransferase